MKEKRGQGFNRIRTRPGLSRYPAPFQACGDFVKSLERNQRRRHLQGIGASNAQSQTRLQQLDYQHLESKGFIGAIECTATGATIQSSGEEVELPDQVLGYVTQIGNMIGESFGLDFPSADLVG